MTKYFFALLIFIVAWPSFAVDPNGYTAQYECRAGNSKCDVDVASLGKRACNQTITSSMPWSSINWSNDTICIEAGDHTSNGTMKLSASGTPSNRKVLRYYRSGDNDDEPWNQSAANQAKIQALDVNGSDYWIIQRITIDPNYSGMSIGLFVGNGSTNNIVNRVLIQRTNAEAVVFGDSTGETTTDNTLQNSVIRTTQASTGEYEHQCISVGGQTNAHFINNEEYDCNKAVHIWGGTSSPGVVVENSDLYVSPAGYTDCNRNYTTSGTCSIMEALISWKSGATSGNPGKIIQNRLWGTRWGDGGLIQAGDSVAISLSNQDINGAQNPNGGADYILVQNNIIFDNENGIWNYWQGPDHNSIVGNLLYKNYDRNPSFGNERGAITVGRTTNSEYYLNTVIDSSPWLTVSSTSNDIRCNVVISSGAIAGSAGSGTQVDNNVYYDTSNSGETKKITNNVVSRANSTNYAVGTILRTGAISTCTTAADTGCFLYKVIIAGQSAPSSPGYCNTLGCTTTDGGMTVLAIRGPYTFYRKLRTAPEKYTIPYARVFNGAPETSFCSSNYASRTGIGINDAP